MLHAHIDEAQAFDDAEADERWIDAAREPIDAATVLQELVEAGELDELKIEALVRAATLARVRSRPERARNLIAKMGRLIDAAQASLDRGDALQHAAADAYQAWVAIGGMVPMTTVGGADAARNAGLPAAWPHREAA